MPDENLNHALTASRPGALISRAVREDEDDRLPDMPPTLPDHVVPNAIAFDAQKALWAVGTGGAIRWRLDANPIQYKVWHAEHGLNKAEVLCILPIGDRVWVGHANGAISVYEQITPARGRWQTPYTHPYPIWALVADADQQVWACADDGLHNARTGEPLAPTPEPPLCAAFALGKLWCGGMNGLWYYDPEGADWEPYETGASFGGVLFLSGNAAGLYVVGIDGTLYITPKGGIVRETVKGFPRALTTVGGVAYLISEDEDGGSILTRLEYGFTKLQRPFGNPVPNPNMIALRSDCLALCDGQSLVLKAFPNAAPLPEGNLLQETRDDRMPDAVATFSTEHGVWAQSCMGQVASQKITVWETRAISGGARLTGVAMLGNVTYFGFAGAEGLGILREGDITITTKNTLRYVEALSVEGGRLRALTLFGTKYSTDGEHWE